MLITGADTICFAHFGKSFRCVEDHPHVVPCSLKIRGRKLEGFHNREELVDSCTPLFTDLYALHQLSQPLVPRPWREVQEPLNVIERRAWVCKFNPVAKYFDEWSGSRYLEVLVD